MEWSNEVVIEFLDLYEHEPVIWCAKDEEHKNRNSINDAWKRIQDKISVNCSIKELKKKKESLMSTFRPLINKVKATSGTGTGAEEVFKPTWFAFVKMASFLQGICKPRNTQNTEELDLTPDEEYIDISEDADFATNAESNEIDTADAESGSSINNANKQFKAPENKKLNLKRKAADTVQGRMDEAYKILKDVINTEKPKTSQTSLYGQLVAQKLDTLDELEQVVVMNEIDNFLFRATMKHMGRQSQTSYSNTAQRYSSDANYPYNFSLGYQPPTYVYSPSKYFSTSVSSPATSHDSELSPGQNIPQVYPSRSSSQQSSQYPSSQSYHSQASPDAAFTSSITSATDYQ